MNTHLFTSESVSRGHPDKLADQISDAILDAFLSQDSGARVACETLAAGNRIIVAGEVSVAKGVEVDVEEIIRACVADIGYCRPEDGFSAEGCAIEIHLQEQSPDIARGVDQSADSGNLGAGDQGMMFGYACRETDVLMPAPIFWAHAVMAKHAQVMAEGNPDWLRPDAKAQLTFAYEGANPVAIHQAVVSTQTADVPISLVREFVENAIIRDVLPEEWITPDTEILVNPTGRFVTGGPVGDAGLTGRKIIVDTYGGAARHGGGAFSGKDPTKVDRSAAYAARWAAKNVVAAGLADRCEVQLAYVIGMARPASILVETFGSAASGIEDRDLERALKGLDPIDGNSPFTPNWILGRLGLRTPSGYEKDAGWNYQQTACHGHFGRDAFPWESIDLVDALTSCFPSVAATA